MQDNLARSSPLAPGQLGAARAAIRPRWVTCDEPQTRLFWD